MTVKDSRGRGLSGAPTPRITLLVITDGRYELLQRTLVSAAENLRGNFGALVLVDDSGGGPHDFVLPMTFGVVKAFRHAERQGLAGAIRTGWDHAPPGWVFHLEDDFTFTGEVDADELVRTCARGKWAQVCLQRQPCNPAEANAGGIIKADPRAYTRLDKVEAHRKLFSLNPCVYPQWVRSVGWPEGGGERESTDRLQGRHPGASFAYWGSRDDDPAVWHIGDYRSSGWKL